MSDSVNVHWGYRAYLETLLCKDKHELATSGQMMLWEKDVAEKFDDTAFAAGKGNTGQLARWAITGQGQFMIEMPLHQDVCNLKQYLVSGCEIRLVYHPADQDLALMRQTVANGGQVALYTYVLSDQVLNWCFVEPSPPLIYRHIQEMAENPAIYTMEKWSVRSFTVPTGVQVWSIDSVVAQLPEIMHVTMVKSSAYNSSQLLSPWNFTHFSLESLLFHVENQQTVEYKPNYTKKFYTKEYRETVLENIKGTSFSYREFPNGYCVYTYRIDTSVRRNHMATNAPATTRLELRFQSNTTENLTLLVYSRANSQFKVDRAKNVYLIH